MKKQHVLASIVIALATTSVMAQDKRGQIEIDPAKKEGTINLDKSGTWKAGASERTKLPEEAKSERDRRQEQQEKSGAVFIRKTF
jgi:hypothetical protein